jgi:anaerobic selenocysteine-containing dehydrogenase
VGDDKKFLRDSDGNPLVWDSSARKAAAYDDAGDIALDTKVTVDGKEYKTAFRVFKDYVNTISLSEAEDITGVPAETIRQVAREFGENAQIGATVEVDGVTLRYRPVAIHTFRGMSAKEYGSQNWRAGLMVQMLVGNFDAVGGLLLHHAGWKKNMEPSACEYPPSRTDLAGSVFYPHATHNVAEQPHLTYLEPEKYALPYKPEMQITFATNRLASTSEVEKQIEGAKKVYQVSIDIVLSEQTQMADIVLPNKSYLECWHFSPTRYTPDSSHSAIRQPVVNAYDMPYQDFDIFWELAKRAGFLDEYVDAINSKWKLKDIKFEHGRDYDAKESVRVIWEAKTGKPLDYAIEHGLIAKSVDVEHRYLHNAEKFRGKGKPKMHFYAEQLVHTKDKVLEIAGQNANVRQVFQERYGETDLAKLMDKKFSPIPLKEHAFPVPHREAKDYPLYLSTYKRIYRNQTCADAMNPVLNEVAHDSSYNYMLINSAKAKELGISDGQTVWIESRVGKVKAKARVTEGIQTDTVAVSYHYGRFSSGFPAYAKEGTAINFVMEQHPDLLSGHNSFQDTKVKVYGA